MDSTPLKRLMIVTIVITALTACGAGSSSNSNNEPNPVTPDPVVPDPVVPEPVTLSGKAADGYLSNARVCLDTNSNLMCETNEPTTTTVAGGSYSLDITEEQNNTYSIVVEVIAGQTIDEDDPDTLISKSYSLSAPVGETFISPLSSLIQNAMRSNAALTLEDATNQIRNALYLPDDSDILSDYIAASDTDAHQRAQFITAVLANALEQSQTNAGGNGLSVAQFGPVLNTILSRIIAQSEAIVDAIDNSDEPSDFVIVSASDSVEDLVASGENISELANAAALLQEGGVHAWTVGSQMVRNVLVNNNSRALEFWDGSDWQDSPGGGPGFPSINMVWAGETEGWVAEDQNANCAVTTTIGVSSALTVVCGVKQYQVALSQTTLGGVAISEFLSTKTTLPDAIAANTTTFSVNAYRLDGKVTTTNPQLWISDCEQESTASPISDCEPVLESTTLATIASREKSFSWGIDPITFGNMFAYLAGDPEQNTSGAIMRLATDPNDDIQVGTWQKKNVNGQSVLLIINENIDYGNIGAAEMAFIESSGNIYEASYIPEQSVLSLFELFRVPSSTIYLNQQTANEIESVIGGYLNAAFGS